MNAIALSDTTLRRAVAVVAAAILGVWALGVLWYADVSVTGLWRFDLDAESSVPAAVSALLLLAAAVVAGLIAWAMDQTRPRLAFGALAVLFAFMAADEWIGVHEKLEKSAGADWQVLYLGVIVVAGVAWALALRELGSRERFLWIGGAVAWAVAQGLETVQWDGDELVHAWMVLPEELLEMTGTAMWLFALLLAVRGGLGPRLRHHVGDRQH